MTFIGGAPTPPSSLVALKCSSHLFIGWCLAPSISYHPCLRRGPRYSFGCLTNALSGRRKSLVLWGPSLKGKTLWARSLGNHLYFRGKFNGKEARAKERSVDYAVFDDMEGGLKFFPGWKHWLGCQIWFNIRVFHQDPPLIRWGKPCIWLSNTDPRGEVEAHEIDWLEANCIFVEIADTIFRANTT